MSFHQARTAWTSEAVVTFVTSGRARPLWYAEAVRLELARQAEDRARRLALERARSRAC